jgi:glycosyltransferase involved in cell wall biosynthesis
MFRVVIIGWSIEKYIERCLNSVIDQIEQDWTACVIIDPCNDRSLEIANSIANKDSRIKVFGNQKQLYATANIIRSITEQSPLDDDIIVTLDGDDWFTDSNTLSIIKKYYTQSSDLLVTHGSWVSYPDPSARTNNAPYSKEDWEKGIRRVNWRASHLRTFKYKVWKCVDHKDLIGPDGLYARVAWDLAIMFPMLEMAGPNRVKFVYERVYTYNQETPYNDSKMRLREQMFFADFFAAKKPYEYKEVL